MNLRVKRVVTAAAVVAGIIAALLTTRAVVPDTEPVAEPSPTVAYSTEVTAALFPGEVKVRDPGDFAKFIALSLAESADLDDCPLVEESERCTGATEAAYLSPDGEFRLTATVLVFDEVIGARELGDAVGESDVVAEADSLEEVVEPPAGVPEPRRYRWATGEVSRFFVVTTVALASGGEWDEDRDWQAGLLSVWFYNAVGLLLRQGYR